MPLSLNDAYPGDSRVTLARRPEDSGTATIIVSVLRAGRQASFENALPCV